jgi:hypothetical protein
LCLPFFTFKLSLSSKFSFAILFLV